MGYPNRGKYVRCFDPNDVARFAPHQGHNVVKLHFIGAMSRHGGKLLHFFDNPSSVTAVDVLRFLELLRPLLTETDTLLLDNCSTHKEFTVSLRLRTMRAVRKLPTAFSRA